VGTFFVAFGLLEDSATCPARGDGNAASARWAERKAVLPMVLGLGCDTMATLTTRILENPRSA